MIHDEVCMDQNKVWDLLQNSSEGEGKSRQGIDEARFDMC